jgi:hypothetical protein
MACKLNSIDNVTWTQAMTEQLLHALGAGNSYTAIRDAIAREHGLMLTRSTIAGKVFRLRRASPDLLPGSAPRHRKRAPAVTKAPPPPSARRGARSGDSLLDLRPGDCKWPVRSEGSQHYFCRLQRVATRSYCAEHLALAYVRARVRPVPAPDASSAATPQTPAAPTSCGERG